MSGIFGIVGQYDMSVIQMMGRRLTHRGSELDIQNVSPTVRMGCAFGRPHSGVQCIQQFTVVLDSWMIDTSNIDKSQSQLLLESYIQLGPESLDRISGQFALAAWDESRQELILARDYTGTLPLYFTYPPSGGMAFASEYKALLAIESVPVEPDLDMIQRLQHYKHLPSTKCLLRNIAAVPPGSVVIFDSKGIIREETYFPKLKLKIQPQSLNQSCKTIANSFLDAVRLQVSGRKNIGVALSGGIDSIGVACACRQLNPDAELHTFTAGYGLDDPEIQTACHVAEKIGAIQHNVIVTPEDMANDIPQLVWHMENPIARSEALQFFKLGQQVRKYVDNLFTGVAADGLFAGLPKHKILWLMHLLPMLRGPLGEFYTLTQSGRKPDSLPGKLLNRLYFRGRVPPVPHIYGSQYVPPPTTFPPNGREFVNEFLCNAFQEGVAQWLPKTERTLSASGVEYTSPYLDRNFIDISFTIPSMYKIYRGKEKYVLRQALREIVPPEVLRIPKFPMRMKYDTTFSDMIDSISKKVLTKQSVNNRGYFNFDEITKLSIRRNGKAYHAEAAMRIWTAVLTEIWAREFVDLRGECRIDI